MANDHVLGRVTHAPPAALSPFFEMARRCLNPANQLRITGISLAGVTTAVGDSVRSELHQSTQVFGTLPPIKLPKLLLLE